MLKRYMHNRERHFAMLDDDRVVHPFDWGMEYITDNPNGDDPRSLFREYSEHVSRTARSFSSRPTISDFDLEGDRSDLDERYQNTVS